MRPRGEVRQVLEQAFKDAGPCTVREVAARAQVGLATAQVTVYDMLRYGDVERVGRAKDAQSQAWAGVYELVRVAESAPEAGPVDESLNELQSVTAMWVIL